MQQYDHWDKVWKKHKYTSDYMLRWYDYLQGISKGMERQMCVLEAGCGSGGGIAIFAKDGHKSVGLDISSVAVGMAKMRYGQAKFQCGDLFKMPFAENSFDIVFNSGVIEHFAYPKNIEAIQAMHRVLKSGGRMILAVPNKLCPWYTFGKHVLMQLGRWPYGFEDDYTPRSFRRCIEKVTGLKLVRIHGLQALPMLALPGFELLPAKYRKIVASWEKALPLKHYYSYAIVAECIAQ